MNRACGPAPRAAHRACLAGAAGLALGAAVATWSAWWPTDSTAAPEQPAPDIRGGVSVIAKTKQALRAARVVPTRSIHPGIHVASLEANVAAAPARLMSFAERFADDVFAPAPAEAETAQPQGRHDGTRLALADPDGSVMPRPAQAQSAAPIRVPASAPAARAIEKTIRGTAAPADSRALAYGPANDNPGGTDRGLSAADTHTAIYDIAAHTVYLPDGRKLEAHSGKGSSMDDPRAANLKMRGPTPPNVYDLTLRERLFHGVRALRLNPVDENRMYGRAGILAHTYMLRQPGASNGCVSFSNYQAFLSAYLNGEVKRMVVVGHLANAPDAKTATRWIPENLKDLFRRS